MYCHGEELSPFCSPMPAAGIVAFGAFHHLLGIFLRCNGFAGIHKAVVDQSSSRPPNTDHDLFLVQVCLWEAFWSFFSGQPLTWPSLVDHISSKVDHIKFTFCHRSQSNQEMGSLLLSNKRRWHYKMMISFLNCSQLMRHPLIELFQLSKLLQIWNYCRVVDVEFLGNF